MNQFKKKKLKNYEYCTVIDIKKSLMKQNKIE